MVYTLDLGVSEAYRHEAEAKCEVREENYEEWEHVTVTCHCGEVFERDVPRGTFEAGYDMADVDAEALYLGAWERHVWAAIKRAGQAHEAAANSVETSDDNGNRWA